MDREQAQVVQLLADVFVKLVLALVAAAVFGAFAIVLMFNPSWPIAIVEVVFGTTVGVVYWHYFPSKRPADGSSRAIGPGPSSPTPPQSSTPDP